MGTIYNLSDKSKEVADYERLVRIRESLQRVAILFQTIRAAESKRRNKRI